MSRVAQSQVRERLSRDRIVRAALDVADERGIDALTMRELGQLLGYEAMALYRHVANKDAILEEILDLILSEVELTSSSDWIDAIRASAISLHETLDRHPWATGLLTTPVGLRPRRLEFAEALLAHLERAGFPDDVCYHAYHVLDAYIIGFSLWQEGHSLTESQRAEVARRLASDVSLDDYPRLLKHHDQHATHGPHHDVSAFEAGLDLMLEGLIEMQKDGDNAGSWTDRELP
jgi:AcrR family transcriptional regulator